MLTPFLAILYAVKDVHEKGMAHMDLKEENIMIMHDGAVKLADFGLVSLQAYKTMRTYSHA